MLDTQRASTNKNRWTSGADDNSPGQVPGQLSFWSLIHILSPLPPLFFLPSPPLLSPFSFLLDNLCSGLFISRWNLPIYSWASCGTKMREPDSGQTFTKIQLCYHKKQLGFTSPCVKALDSVIPKAPSSCKKCSFASSQDHCPAVSSWPCN